VYWSYLESLTFSWSTVQDEISGLNNYMLQITTGPGFEVVSYSSNTKKFSVTGLASLPVNKYWWRVGTVDVAGNTSWSQSRSFIKSGPATKLQLACSTQTIKSDGMDTATLTVIVQDINGYRIENAVSLISFTVTGGTLSSGFVIPSSGTAQVYLSSLRSSEPIVVTVYTEGLSSSCIIINSDMHGVPYKLDLKPDKNTIIANNMDMTAITAGVKDIYDVPILGQQIQVKFGTNGYGIIVSSTEVTTDIITGKAAINLISSTTVGNIMVYGYVTGLSTGVLTIQSLPGTAHHIGISSGSVLTADGTSISTITARVLDENNNLVVLTGLRIVFDLVGQEYGYFTGTLWKTGEGYPYVDTVNGVSEINIKTTKLSGTIQIFAKDEYSGLGLVPGSIAIQTVSSGPIKVMIDSQYHRLLSGSESTVITARITDENDNTVITSTKTVVISIYNGINKRYERSIPAINGIAEYEYADVTAGKMIISATADGLQGSYTEVINVWNKTTGGEYLFNEQVTKLSIPAWAIDANIRIDLTTATIPVTVDTHGLRIVTGSIKEFKVYDETDTEIISPKFNRDITMVIGILIMIMMGMKIQPVSRLTTSNCFISQHLMSVLLHLNLIRVGRSVA
jgi:hypothetical protein